MKTFNTNNVDTIKSYQIRFNFDMPSTLWAKRIRTFNIKFSASNNMFCKTTAPSHAHFMLPFGILVKFHRYTML